MSHASLDNDAYVQSCFSGLRCLKMFLGTALVVATLAVVIFSGSLPSL